MVVLKEEALYCGVLGTMMHPEKRRPCETPRNRLMWPFVTSLAII
jgi:hypothetical protein